jgi:hypothetical protein
MSVGKPAVAISQAITEFEFHISPAPDSSRPQTGVGMVGRRSRIRCANAASSDIRTGLAIASSASGIRPSRQRRIS